MLVVTIIIDIFYPISRDNFQTKREQKPKSRLSIFHILTGLRTFIKTKLRLSIFEGYFSMIVG